MTKGKLFSFLREVHLIMRMRIENISRAITLIGWPWLWLAFIHLHIYHLLDFSNNFGLWRWGGEEGRGAGLFLEIFHESMVTINDQNHFHCSDHHQIKINQLGRYERNNYFFWSILIHHSAVRRTKRIMLMLILADLLGLGNPIIYSIVVLILFC